VYFDEALQQKLRALSIEPTFLIEQLPAEQIERAYDMDASGIEALFTQLGQGGQVSYFLGFLGPP
jgi:hypothetical protein